MSDELVVGRAIPAAGAALYKTWPVPEGYVVEKINAGESAEGPASSRMFDPRLQAGRALALVHELRAEKKISSADRDVLLAVLRPIAHAEAADASS